MESTPEFTILKYDAQDRIRHWKTHQTEIQSVLLNQPNLINSPCLQINAFTFKLDDLYKLFVRIHNHNNPSAQPLPPPSASNTTNPIKAIRFYLGLKEDPTNEIPPYACMMAVPVENFNPMSFNGGADIVYLPQGSEASSIYDFSFPCPSTCAEVNQSIMDLS